MQQKLNVINFGILGNVTDRRGGMFSAAMGGLVFFWATDPSPNAP